MLYIARIFNNYTGKFGVPRQSGLVGNSLSRIVFEPGFRNPDALRGLEGFSHIWLIWEFSEAVRRKNNELLRQDREKGITNPGLKDPEKRTINPVPGVQWSPTVRPPRLGGNERLGVFATRSPFRPNPIGLSCVRIEKIELNTEKGPVIIVKGADLMNGTPIFDIKPYIPYADAHPDALGGFTAEREFATVSVTIDPAAAGKLIPEEQSELISLLEQDPRPAYKRDVKKTYRFNFAGREIEFEGDGNVLTVTNVH